jgi:hemolysin activation/secretion protein
VGAASGGLAGVAALEVLDVAIRKVRSLRDRRDRPVWPGLVAPFVTGLLLMGLSCAVADAQLPPPPREPPTLPFEVPRPLPTPSPILPPIPPAPPRQLEPLPRVRVFVREIRVVGSTIFSADELAKVTAPYVNREVTTEDLEALRLALTRLYVDRGYVSSGAILPDQPVTEGVITYQIIEGRLTAVEVEGNKWFRSSYFTKRFSLAGKPPLNVNALQERLQLFLEDPRIQRLNAELKPGLKPGEAILDVRVEDRIPFKFWVDLNNYQSPSIGAERVLVTAEDQNLTGNGDILTLQWGMSPFPPGSFWDGDYGKSVGMNPWLDFKYWLPFTAWDTTAIFQYRRTETTVIEKPFDELDIQDKTEYFTVGLRQPIYRTPGTEVALQVLGEHISDRTFLLGEQFSLSPGAQNGVTNVTAIRAIQEFVHRSQDQVIAARSRLSFGVNLLDATINTEKDVPDGQFFAWLGQFQWVRRLPRLLDTLLIFRADLQVTPDSLVTLEQFPVGGRYSVRGYRENTLVRDNAFVTSLEARIPVLRNVPVADYVQLAPFFDYGRSWNTKLPNTPDITDIYSIGIGIRWALTLPWPIPVQSQFELYWGYKLKDVESLGGNLQDKGLHFQFIIGAL